MNILRQSLAFVLTLAIAFPAFGDANGIGQALETQGATVRNIVLQQGATLFSDDTVSVGDSGSARIALAGGSQVELLNRRRWRTRLELATALFEYLEIFHNLRRRHSALGMRTPIEFERLHHETTVVA